MRSGCKRRGLWEQRNLALHHAAHLSILETRKPAPMILQEEEGSSDSFQEHLRGSGSTGE